MANVTEKELKFLFPETVVEIAGHEFTLTPFSFVETRIVAEKMKDVLYLFAGDITPDVLIEIYSKGYNGVRDVIAMTLDIKPALVDKFDQQSALKAITHIIEVNKDFFTQQVESEMDGLTKILGMAEDSSNTEK